ncbi:putative endonuclease [Litorivivens lipolytica]|uniref:UPF0102 protein FHR99_001325 n=1 Tax=Litorivivens lipolytica TaxID=1524264 RepID=A0A7W4Z536_9GAMM|nr:YraN family protein [Litorivivens lipolytica]MBB3047089.1 putative endonuclease [Litorivivens lipolytica]
MRRKATAANRTQFGNFVEEQTCRWLTQQGVHILERNFRCRSGEIDIIGRHRGFLVFIEVRFRRSNRYGGAAASVDARKQLKLAKAAQFFLLRHRALQNAACRFDVIAVSGKNVQPGSDQLEFDWHRAAFSLDDISHAF